MNGKNSLFGFWLIFAGLMYFLVLLVFPVCAPTAAKIMKCFWTARALMGIGTAVIIGGLLYLCFRNPCTRLGLCLMTAVLAVLGASFPTFLIGVCMNESMPCRAGAQPAWVILSGVLLVTSLVNARMLAKTGRQETTGSGHE